MELKRVLLKLSGEALAGDKKTGFDEATVKEVARQVKTAVDDGIEVGIVIGGGNFWRGRQSNAIDRTKADQIGMLATVMNCIYVSEIFRSEGMMTQILTPFECGSITIQEVIDKQLAVVDLTASIMCMENHVPMAVFSLNEKDGIVNAMRGKINGTVVTA